MRERAVAGFELVSLAMVLVVQWVAFASRVDVFADRALTTRELWLSGIGAVSVVAALALAIRPVSLIAGRPRGPSSFLWSVVWRTAAYTFLIAGTAGLVPRYHFLSAVPLGMLGGSDCLLTLWALGVAPATRVGLRRFLFSTVHFGILGALLAAALLGNEIATFPGVFDEYFALWTGIVVGGATITGLNRWSSYADAQSAADRDEIVAAEHTHRAQWLHDDVLSEVRFTMLRIDAGVTSSERTHRELQDLDHRLRLRRLDELVRRGNPHIYEIIQPHLRRAQSQGVELYQVPRLDVTERRVDEPTGELVNRAMSVLVTNAIIAGATRMAVTIREPDDLSMLELTLTDDAGGFDLDSVPDGRGLASLIRDLAPGTVRRTDSPGGSIMTVLIPIPKDSTVPTKEIHTP